MGNYNAYGDVKSIKLPATDTLPERTCYDIYKDSPSSRKSIDPEEEFLQDVLLCNDNLFNWSQIAYQVLKSADSDWDHSGKGWDNNFGKNANYMDLIDYLCNAKSESKGQDKFKSTGLVMTHKLSDVEQEAGKLIEQLIGRKLKAKDFINQCDLNALHDNTEQTVFYTMAGYRDRYGNAGLEFSYNAMGLAFYNFRLKVLSDDQPYNSALTWAGLTLDKAVEDAKNNISHQGFEYKAGKSENTVVNRAENHSAETTSQTVTQKLDQTDTEYNSITESKEHRFTEMIGATFAMSDILNMGKISLSMQFTAGQVIGTAYTKEKSVSKTYSHSSGVTVSLPPDTVALVRQETSQATTALKYDCPVMVQYDVAVFSMYGKCYDDNACVHKFNTVGYDQCSFVSLFKSVNGVSAGEDGAENLYMRYNNNVVETKSGKRTVHEKVAGYDKTHGVTQAKTRRKGLTAEALDWSRILTQQPASTGYRSSQTMEVCKLMEQVALNRPMSVTGAKLSDESREIKTVIDPIMPMYPLTEIRQTVGASQYDMGIGTQLYISNWATEGIDSKGISFYGYSDNAENWKLVDKNGKPLSDSVAEIMSDPFVANSRYILAKKDTGDDYIYAKYVIPENTYRCVDGTCASDKSVNTAYVKINIHDTKLEGESHVEGSLKVKAGTVTNLDAADSLTVIVKDKTGKQITVPVIWQADPDNEDGLTIIGNQMSVSIPGNYRIRAKYERLFSNWIEVIVMA